MKRDDQIITIRDNGTIDCAVCNDEPSMTQQHHAADCDINNIMKKYETTGQFTGHIKQGGQYADFSQITDFQDMLHTVRYAQDAFMTLPAHIRKIFDNNPHHLLEFIQDPKNYDEGVTLGLIDPDIKFQKQLKQKQMNDLNEQLKKQAAQQPQPQPQSPTILKKTSTPPQEE